MSKIIYLSDLDGCIIDTPKADTAGLEQGITDCITDATRQKAALSVVTLGFITKLVATDFDKFFPRIFDAIDNMLEECKEAVLTDAEKQGIEKGYFGHRLTSSLPAVPGAIESINRIDAPLGIVTSNPVEEVRTMLKNLGIDGSRVDIIVDKKAMGPIARQNAVPWIYAELQIALMREFRSAPKQVRIWEDDLKQLKELDSALRAGRRWNCPVDDTIVGWVVESAVDLNLVERERWCLQASTWGCTPEDKLLKAQGEGVVDEVVSKFTI